MREGEALRFELSWVAAGGRTRSEPGRRLRASLGVEPKREIVVQVMKGVSEKRVERFLARARKVSFVNVTRLAEETGRGQDL